MIIYIDANGEVLEQEYTEVVQGDNDANNIYLIAPLAQNAVVTMSFECPNGYVTDPNSDIYKMTPSIDNMVGGLRMWKLSIKNIPITQYYGIVKYQIKATINGKTIAVARGKFKVQEGVDWQLPGTPDVNVYADILNALNQVEAGFINKVDINYNNDDVEQEIINNENGLKLVKTEGETTAVYEFKADGLYQNGVKLVDAEELEAVERDVEGLFSITDTLNADLSRLREDTETHLARLYSTKVDIDVGNSKIVNSNTQISLTHANAVGQATTEATSAVLQNGVLKLQLDDRFYFNGKPEIVGERATIAIYSKEQNGEKDIVTLSVADKELVVDEQKAVIKTNGVADEIMTASKTATKIVSSVDNQTYVLNFELQNNSGETISTSQIDLPLESVVVNGTYADGILTLTLKNGNSVDINITDIISGLATEQYVDYKISELNNKIDNLPTCGVTEDYVNTQISRAVAYKLESQTMSVVVLADQWEQEDNDPFAYKAVIQTTIQGVEGVSSSQISSDAIYELINNNPINFAKYGFALNDVYRELDENENETFMFEFLAVEKPTQQILFQIVITGTQVDIGGAV